jgi:hypothetical protein
MSFRTAVLAAIVAISVVTPVQSAFTQNYPTKPIHLIVPYPAGGGTDFFARLVGQKMSELVGQPIVVENKPGSGDQSRRRFRRQSAARRLHRAARRCRDLCRQSQPLQETPIRPG